MTPEEFGSVLTAVNDAWQPPRPFGVETVRLFAATVGDVPPEAAAAAVVSLVEEGREFVPSLGVLLRRAREIAGLAPADDFDAVWDEVMRAVRRTGSWGSPKWTSPDVARLVESIGWRAFCATAEEDLPVVRAQMRDFWATIRQRARVRDSVERQVRGGLPDPRPHGRIGPGGTKAIENGGAA